MKSIILLVSGIIAYTALFGQNHNNNWYFGSNAGLSFNTIPPTTLKGKLINYGGSASISDPEGNLLFYTDGKTIWDRNHKIMPSGTGLTGGLSSQPALIAPLPGSNTKYYLFTVEGQGSDGGISYSIIDMKLNAGFGDIVEGAKNILLLDKAADKITSTTHPNGRDIWIITHKLNSNEFVTYLLTPNGLSSPLVSTVGSIYPIDAFEGPLKISHLGSKIVSACALDNIFEMFDFDLHTGILSNQENLNNIFITVQYVEGLEFSPNDSMLYISSFAKGTFHNNLFQLNLITKDLATINISQDIFYGALLLGLDNKIYKANPFRQSLGIIHLPNKPGLECLFEEEGLILSDSTLSFFELPSLSEYSFALDSSFIDVLGNDTIICFGNELNLKPSYPINCDSTIILWNTGSTDSSIIINISGVYTVRIENSCGIIFDTINVDFISCLPIVEYTLDECRSYMFDNSHLNYSEFVPFYPTDLACGILNASTVYKSYSEMNKHSCTEGNNGSAAMCIGVLNSCEYFPGSDHSLKIDINIRPTIDSAIYITGLQFYHKSPLFYNWLNGGSGGNNFAQKLGFRILRNDIEIYRDDEIEIDFNWQLVTLNFLNNPAFRIADSAVFEIEFLPYCPIGLNLPISVWDIDEIKIFGGCLSPISQNFSISGNVKNINGIPLENQQIYISKDSLFTSVSMTYTDDLGNYRINRKVPDKYYLKVSGNNDDILNGVSTLDIIEIQQHLLGVNQFNSIFQLIAADVNKNNLISTFDMLEIRKLLLGKSTEFPRNKSWRYGNLPIRIDFLEFDIFKEIASTNTNNYIQFEDFVAVKIGDVNGDVNVRNRNNCRISNELDSIYITCSINKRINNNQNNIKFISNNAIAIYGIQLELSGDNLNDYQILSGAINLTKDNYNIINNKIIISASFNKPKYIHKGDVLFYLTSPFIEGTTYNNDIYLENNYLNSEVYLDDFSIIPVKLNLEYTLHEGVDKNKYQVLNNLFIDYPMVHLDIKKETRLRIEVVDIYGKRYFAIDNVYSVGKYEFSLPIINLPKFGFCQFISNDELETICLVKIE